MSKVLTLREVAEELRCSVSTVRQLISRGQLGAINIGTASHRHYRITREALDDYKSLQCEPVATLTKPRDPGIRTKSFLKLG